MLRPAEKNSSTTAREAATAWAAVTLGYIQ